MLIMKKLLTFGVFDILHYGHVNLFRRSKELTSTDNRLVVAVQDSDFILKFKPDTKIVNTLENRLLMVGAIRYVDECNDDPYRKCCSFTVSIGFCFAAFLRVQASACTLFSYPKLRNGERR